MTDTIIGSESPLPAIYLTDNGLKMGLATISKDDKNIAEVFRIGNNPFRIEARKLRYLIPDDVRPKGLELTQLSEWIPKDIYIRQGTVFDLKNFDERIRMPNLFDIGRWESATEAMNKIKLMQPRECYIPVNRAEHTCVWLNPEMTLYADRKSDGSYSEIRMGKLGFEGGQELLRYDPSKEIQEWIQVNLQEIDTMYHIYNMIHRS